MSQDTTTNNGRTSQLEDSLARVVEAGHEAIDSRLTQLDGEWSVGRMVKATAGLLILGGLGLSFFLSPWLAIVPALGGLMLAQNLYSRKSWLGDLFAGMGFRTSVEIDHERMALKAIRGDFRHLPTIHEIEDRDAISRFEDEGGPVFESEQPRVAPREAAREVLAATKR
jgi:hypothetical protein